MPRMPRVKWVLAMSALALLVVLGFLRFTGVLMTQEQAPQVAQSTEKPMPEVFANGASLFNAHCATCHGAGAAGTDRGPSFLSPIYAASHHSDASFFLAVKQGVRAHHWQFGDMPPLPDVTTDQAAEIIVYVRWLQAQAGIR